jgi:hypothetical protein
MNLAGYLRLFKLLDGYARSVHWCFVTELFFNEEDTAYIVCFRPTDGSSDSPHLQECRYLEIATHDAWIAVKAKMLPDSLAEQLDIGLVGLIPYRICTIGAIQNPY